MPFALKDVVLNAEKPKGITLQVDSTHDWIRVYRNRDAVGHITRRQVDDNKGNISALLEKFK